MAEKDGVATMSGSTNGAGGSGGGSESGRNGGNGESGEVRAGELGRSRYPGLSLFDLRLTDREVAVLLSGDPKERARMFEVAPALTEADAEAVPVLQRAIALLREIAEGEPVKATAKGNLPQALVKRLFAGAIADAEPDYVRVNREDDSMALSIVRRLAQNAGLLSYRKQEFRLTKAGRAVLEAADWSELYRLLLEGHLKRPHLLERYDGLDDGGAVSATLPLLLFAARDDNREWLYEEDFAELAVGAGAAYRVDPEDLTHAVVLRFFERFGAVFGLFEEGPTFQPPVEPPTDLNGPYFYPYHRWRRTPLFDQVFRWHIAAPQRAVLLPMQASHRLMEWVHEPEYELDGTGEPGLQAICIRAIERCPTNADGYVVWARLWEHRPEEALKIVDAGLEATEGREPDVPPGWSSWGDHEYRDVMRLYFIRAETLLALDRTDEAFEEFERLLRIDAEDGIGTRFHYVPALITAQRYTRARQVQDQFKDEVFAADVWNSLLTALALGDERYAERLLPKALEQNPFIPELLLSRSRSVYEPLPDYYSPGTAEEAVIYIINSEMAWRAVSGAREWVRERSKR